jgi:hypothetical protein
MKKLNASISSVLALMLAAAMSTSAMAASVKTSKSVSAAYPWYNSHSKLYYDSKTDALAAYKVKDAEDYVSYAYGKTSTEATPVFVWYSSYTGLYYRTKPDAVEASKNSDSYVKDVSADSKTKKEVKTSETASDSYLWYSTSTKLYYQTKDDAMSQSGNNAAYVIKVDPDKVNTSTKNNTSTDTKTAAAVTTDANAKLPAPENIVYTAKSDSITLKWDAVDGAEAYRIYMYNRETKKLEKYKNVSKTTCKVKDLTADTKYIFKIAAIDKVNDKYVEGSRSKQINVKTIA